MEQRSALHNEIPSIVLLHQISNYIMCVDSSFYAGFVSVKSSHSEFVVYMYFEMNSKRTVHAVKTVGALMVIRFYANPGQLYQQGNSCLLNCLSKKTVAA